MTTTTIGGLTGVTSLTGSDMIVVELASGNVTRKITLTSAADDFRAIMGVVMAIVDNAAFTDGSTELQPIGGVFDETEGTALTENDLAAPRIDAKRAWIAALEDATTRGQRLGITANGEAKVLSATTVTRIAATQFARPADLTTYAAFASGTGDLLANSTTAGSVVVQTYTGAARTAAGSFQIRRARIRKSTTTLTNAVFRVHYFSEAPTVTTAGDNSTFSNVVNTNDTYLGSIDVTIDRVFTSGSVGIGIPTAGNEINVDLASGTAIYSLTEVLAAYAPGSAETFDMSIEVVQL